MGILVTGGSRGIGRTIALEFADDHDVAIGYNVSESDAKDVVADIESDGGTAIAVQADVADSSEVQRMVETTVEEFGELDAVVNNAGITDPARLQNLDDEQWNRVISTNLTGAFYVTRSAIPHIVPDGDIVFISSIGGTGGTVDASYAASKAGLHGLTRALAREFGGEGLQVNAVAPGPAETSMNDQILAHLEDIEFRGHENVDTHLPQYACKPEDVAHTVRYLLENEYIQGEIINVNGGMQFR